MGYDHIEGHGLLPYWGTFIMTILRDIYRIILRDILLWSYLGAFMMTILRDIHDDHIEGHLFFDHIKSHSWWPYWGHLWWPYWGAFIMTILRDIHDDNIEGHWETILRDIMTILKDILWIILKELTLTNLCVQISSWPKRLWSGPDHRLWMGLCWIHVHYAEVITIDTC